MLPACKSVCAAALAAAIAVVVLMLPARAAVIFDASGTSAAGNPVAFRAMLTVSGSTLSLELENRSPVNSVAAADVLTSFYFDIVSGTSRPGLALTSGSGFVWQVRANTNDLEYRYIPQTFTQVSGIPSDLKAVNNGDASWQFRALDVAADPFLGFGIGTVGNSDFSPNGLAPAVVGPPGNGMINFGIYKGGDIDPVGILDQKYLVKNKAAFRFGGVAGWTEAEIGGRAVFGMGTNPDSILVVPEPASTACCGIGAMAAAWLVAAWLSRTRRSGP